MPGCCPGGLQCHTTIDGQDASNGPERQLQRSSLAAFDLDFIFFSHFSTHYLVIPFCVVDYHDSKLLDLLVSQARLILLGIRTQTKHAI